MALDDLLTRLTEETKKECDALLEEARLQVEEIKKQAAQEEKQFLSHASDRQRQSWEAEGRNLVYHKQLEIEAQRNTLIQGFLDQVSKDVLGKVSNLRASNNYNDFFARLAKEALKDLEEGVKVEVDPRDLDLVKAVLNDDPPKIETTLTTGGGLVVTTSDGKIRVDNTVEARLERARRMVGHELVKILQGEG